MLKKIAQLMSVALFFLLPHTLISDEFCNNDLLYSYGILASGFSEEKSILCGNAKPDTCCSEKAEIITLRNWNEVNKVKVKQYMESYVYLFKAILNFYPFFVDRAKEVQNFPGASDKCKDAAQNMIIKYKTDSEVFEFVDDLSKIYTHLGFIRKSFYCALCSVSNQEYFNIKMKKITFANTFCHNLVITTIEMFHLRNTDFLDIMNSMNTLKDCDPNNPKEEDPYKMSLKLDQTDQINLNKCFDIYSKDKDPRVFMEDCTDYCKSYSMTKATEMFEGSFGKLHYLFDKLTAVSVLFFFSKLKPNTNS